jgi:V/A-type H+-transporting ATPase subunit E
MAENTIESFVTKLQEEGIAAGKLAADQLRAEAQKQADNTLEEAKKQAAKILADAETEAKNILARSKSELELATRDIILKLRATLENILKEMILGKVRQELSSETFLKEILQQLVSLYAQSDLDSEKRLQLDVSKDLQGKLTEWAKNILKEANLNVDINGTLASAGFEYQFSGGTVEVTPESAAQALCELIAPGMRDMVNQAAGALAPETNSQKG